MWWCGCDGGMTRTTSRETTTQIHHSHLEHLEQREVVMHTLLQNTFMADATPDHIYLFVVIVRMQHLGGWVVRMLV